jgi:hypothetical protein
MSGESEMPTGLGPVERLSRRLARLWTERQTRTMRRRFLASFAVTLLFGGIALAQVAPTPGGPPTISGPLKRDPCWRVAGPIPRRPPGLSPHIMFDPPAPGTPLAPSDPACIDKGDRARPPRD